MIRLTTGPSLGTLAVELSHVVPSAPASASPLAPALGSIDALFRVHDRPTVAGAAVIVLRGSEILHARGYGLADVEAGRPVDDRTNFRLASVTKQFIGMAVAMLVERRILRYGQTLAEFFPSFLSYGQQITILQLLHHTSGFLDYEDLIPRDFSGQLSDRDVLGLLAAQTSTRFTPGSRYAYSNGGYVLLGLIVEAASGRRLDAFLHSEIFAPLGMTETLMYEGEATVIRNRAYGYTDVGGTFRRTDQNVTSATRGDGGVYSSIRDLVAWDRALSSNTLASAATMARIFEPGTLSDGTCTTYGFGWELSNYRGIPRVSHSGGSIGFRTVIQRFPTRKLTVAVLINREGAMPWDLASCIVDLCLFGASEV